MYQTLRGRLKVWARGIKRHVIPAPVMAALRVKAAEYRKPKSRAGLVAIITIWVAAVALTAWWLWPL